MTEVTENLNVKDNECIISEYLRSGYLIYIGAYIISFILVLTIVFEFLY